MHAMIQCKRHHHFPFFHFSSITFSSQAFTIKTYKTRKIISKPRKTRIEKMEIQRNKSNKSINYVCDTDSEASQFESFHSSDSPPPSLPNRLPPPPGYGVAMERERRGEDRISVGGERKPRRGVMVKRAEFGCRVCEVVFCLGSLAVMVSDKTKGWAGDSYYRYVEYRYCAAVNAIGLIYSGLQACDLTLGSIRGKHIVFHRLRYQFDFAIDQIIAYLLISASSSGATRVDEWVSNWGQDEFTKLAAASIIMSFLAFAAFSVSSIISGYNLFL